MNKIVKTATGPVTPEGKATSSKNATKDAIFAKGLLPWEDAQTLTQLMFDLQKQWGGHASAKLLMLPIEQAYIEIQRLMMAQKNRIEGVMQSVDIARQFALEAGIDILLVSQLPTWFFLEDDGGQKDWALYVDRVQEQALELKAKFNDRVVPTIAQQYPDLYEYVMAGYSQNQSFLTVLGHRYRQPTPILNLGLVSNEIGEKYPQHLVWARAPERHEIIIKGIRSEQMIEAMNLDQFARYLTRSQNAITKGLQSLAALKETMRIEEERKRTLDLTQPALEIVQVNSSTIAANASVFTQIASGTAKN